MSKSSLTLVIRQQAYLQPAPRAMDAAPAHEGAQPAKLAVRDIELPSYLLKRHPGMYVQMPQGTFFVDTEAAVLALPGIGQ